MSSVHTTDLLVFTLAVPSPPTPACPPPSLPCSNHHNPHMTLCKQNWLLFPKLSIPKKDKQRYTIHGNVPKDHRWSYLFCMQLVVKITENIINKQEDDKNDFNDQRRWMRSDCVEQSNDGWRWRIKQRVTRCLFLFSRRDRGFVSFSLVPRDENKNFFT